MADLIIPSTRFILCRAFSLGLWVFYPHLIHLCDFSLLSAGCLGFLLPLAAPFLSVSTLISTLGSSSAITCIQSLVTLNIRPISIAVSRVRPLLFSRHRWLSRLFCDLHAIALRIHLSVLAMSSPLASSLRSVTKVSKVSPGCCRFQSNWTAAMMGFFLASRCVCFFSLTFWRFSPVSTFIISHWKIRYISRPLLPTKLIRLQIFSFSEHLLSGPPNVNSQYW